MTPPKNTMRASLTFLRSLIALATISFPLLTPAQSAAIDPSTIDPSTAARQWVEQLDAPSFAARRQASRELHALGIEGIDALTEGARSASPEVSQRCLQLLQDHFRSGSPNVREASEDSLRELSNDADPGLAVRASRVLNLEKEEGETPAFEPGKMPNAPPVQRKVTIRNINGIRTIEVDENGRRVTIKVEGEQHTVERPGAAEPQATRYPSEQALQEADREAYRILKQYDGGNLQIFRGQRKLPGINPNDDPFERLFRGIPELQPRRFRPERPRPPVVPRRNPVPEKPESVPERNDLPPVIDV